MEYRLATASDLEKIWNKDIKENAGDERYVRWKSEYIQYNVTGKCVTFVAVAGSQPIGQVNILFSPECSAIKGNNLLCDGKTVANVNAVRIDKKFEGQGHIHKLFSLAEEYAKQRGIATLTIGVEAKESRNLAIYFHFGYTEFVTSMIDDNELILYYSKSI